MTVPSTRFALALLAGVACDSEPALDGPTSIEPVALQADAPVQPGDPDAKGPSGLRVAYVYGGGEGDLMADAWRAGVAGEGEEVPLLFALVGRGSSPPVQMKPGGEGASKRRETRLRDARGRRPSGRTVLAALEEGSMDCGRAGAASFLERHGAGAELVALAMLPSRDPERGRLTLRRRPGLEAEGINEMKERRFVVWEDGAFFRASAVHWLRAVGLSSVEASLKPRRDKTSLKAQFNAEQYDYAFVVASRKQAELGTAVELEPDAFADPNLLLNLFVCRNDAVVRERDDIVDLFERWSIRHPASAPHDLDPSRLEALGALLTETGIVPESVAKGPVFDRTLYSDARARGNPASGRTAPEDQAMVSEPPAQD